MLRSAKKARFAHRHLPPFEGCESTDQSAEHPVDFPVVGIGCSAGGLDALEKFLSHVPANSGFAFVIVQHLAPAHVSALPQILQRSTSMSVIEVADNTPLAANHVFVIPPNRNLSLSGDKLRLFEPAAPHALRLPIDFFFGTLALERREKAVGIVLSGMGSDGADGLRTIKQNKGLCLAQEPVTAAADSMPASAIATGVVDIIASPEQLPVLLAKHLARPVTSQQAPDQQDLLQEIIALLQEHCHNDFSLYKSNTMERRIERRSAIHRIHDMAQYVQYLRDTPQEIELLHKELLIGVTHFFRDPEVWDYLRDQAFPALFARNPGGKPLRVWVAACSSGEEAYSLAITFMDALARFKPAGHFTLQIYATDLDPDAINRARKGLFPGQIVAEVSAVCLERYFAEEENGYRIKKEVRDMIVFATQNIISDPPFTRLDILSCRNLLIYFGAELQKKLLPLFHYALNRDGLLILGRAESLGTSSHLFSPGSSKNRVYWRIEQLMSLSELAFPNKTLEHTALSPTPSHGSLVTDSPGVLIDQLIQQNYAPPAVLVNAEGDIIYISGRTGTYLEPAAGKVNINIHAMAREGLREALAGIIRKALQHEGPLYLKGVVIPGGGGAQVVDVTVRAIEKPDVLRGQVLIVFYDVATPKPARKGNKSTTSSSSEMLQQELQRTREALQAMQEEMQSSMEELRSANEELQSTNEELQSTNEELTTSKEEMQSMNEELQTVNAELQSKMEDLSEIKNDLMNLLNSTEIATIFLDNDLRVRRFTSHVTPLFKLIPGDIGRPLSDIVTDFNSLDLEQDTREVLRTLVFQEKQAGTSKGQWYRVRIMPYRTQEDVIDGVVITFTDITEMVQLQAKL